MEKKLHTYIDLDQTKPKQSDKMGCTIILSFTLLLWFHTYKNLLLVEATDSRPVYKITAQTDRLFFLPASLDLNSPLTFCTVAKFDPSVEEKIYISIATCKLN